MVRKKKAQSAAQADAPPRAVIYARLSRSKSGTDRADADRKTEATLATQQAGCERHIAALGGVVVALEHDVASGDRLDVRHGLFRALERIASGEADTLIVYALDRLSRDSVQQAGIVQELRKHGATLLSATETVEDGHFGDLMRAVYAFGAALEIAKGRERVNRSLDAKFRQQKRYKPAQRPPYGYRRIGTGEQTVYEIDPAESLVVERIYRERAAGSSIRQIVLGLRRDAIPTPTGRGNWSTHPVQIVLERECYWSGEHEVWRTKTERDGENVPYLVDRPAEERYTVPFPAFIDRDIAAAAAEAGKRNRWQSNRHDRTGRVGILRYGFVTCGSCGRAMVIRKPKVGNPRYVCAQHGHLSRPCPATVSISVDKLDLPVWYWLQSLMENPANADAWVPTFTEYMPDATLSAAIMEAGRELTDLERQRDNLTANLARVSGAAAAALLARLESVAGEIEALKAGRIAPLLTQVDRGQAAHRGGRTLNATDAVTKATVRALHAMQEADPEPEQTHRISFRTSDGDHAETVPDSWAGKRAAMSELGLRVQVFPESAAQPRWVAEMTVAQSATVRGKATPDGWYSRPAGLPDDYLFPIPRCSR